MAGVEDEDEFRDADDGADTTPPPSSSPASTPSKSKLAAAAGGFVRRLLASIGLPTSFSAAIGRFAAPSSLKPPVPQPRAGPNLGLGLLLHLGPNPSADCPLVSDALARNLYLPLTPDLQKRHEEVLASRVLGEQGSVEDVEDHVIGHDVGVGEELAVLVPTEQEGQEKEDVAVADGYSGNSNGYFLQLQHMNKEGEQHKSDELEPAIEDHEAVEQEGATEYYNAVEDQCISDDLGVPMGDNVVQDQEVVVLDQEGVTGCFDVAVEDQSNNCAVEQCTSDELEAAKDGNFVEEKEKATVEEGAIDILGSTKDDVTLGSQEEGRCWWW